MEKSNVQKWLKFGVIFFILLAMIAGVLIFSISTNKSGDEAFAINGATASGVGTLNLGSYECGGNSSSTSGAQTISFSGNASTAKSLGHLRIRCGFTVENNKASKTQELHVYNGSTELCGCSTSAQGDDSGKSPSSGWANIPASSTITVKATCRGGKVVFVSVIGKIKDIWVEIGYTGTSGSFSSADTNKGTVGTSSYNFGTDGFASSATSTATAKTGYHFSSWSGTNVSTSGTTATIYGYNANGNYTANFAANTYTVKYDGNKPSNATGTVGSLPSNATWTYNSNATLGGTPTLTGWTFGGWYKESGCTNKVGDASASLTKPNLTSTNGGTVTLYAKWTAKTYTVAYNGNKPSTATGSVTSVPGNATWTYDSNATLAAAPSLPGYSFAGWYKEAACTTSAGAASATLTKPNYATSGTVNLYAKWTANTYTITYYGGGGTPSATSKTATYDGTYGTLATATRTGYTFSSWLFGRQRGNVTLTAGTSSNYTFDNNFPALALGKTYTVTFGKATLTAHSTNNPTKFAILVYDFDANASRLSTQVEFGSGRSWTFTVPNTGSATNTKLIYYAGINGATAGNTVAFEDVALFYHANPVTASTKFNLYAGNSALLATWTANQYSFNLYNNYELTASAGHTLISSGTATYDSNMPSITVPTRAGYTFLGFWDKVAKGEGTQYYKADGTAARTCNFTATKSLYAQWEDKTYNVVFDPNGGSLMTGVRYIRDTNAGSSGNEYQHVGEIQAWTFDGVNKANYSVNSAVKYSTNGTSYVTPTGDWLKVFDGAINTGYVGCSLVYVDLGAVYDIESIVVQHFPDRVYYKTKTEVSADGVTWSCIFDSGSTAYKVNGPRMYAEPTTGHRVYATSASGRLPLQKIHIDHNENLRVLAPTRAGYTFLGWSTSASATTATYTDGVSVKNLSSTKDATVTLYAVWKANTYTLSYDTRGGNSIASKQVTFGSTYGTLSTPTKTGYTFLGWRLLPAEYQQVDYIQGSTNGYVLTDVTPGGNSSIRMVATPTTVSGNQAFWVARGADTNTATFTTFAIGSGVRFDFGNATGAAAGALSANTKVTVSAEKNRGYLNNTALTSYLTSTFTAGNKLMFLASYYNGTGSNLTNYSSMKMYGATYWNNGTVAAYFVPCYRLSDNKIGLYDIVGDKFYAGSGVSKGSNVYITSSTEFAVGKNVTLYAMWSFTAKYDANKPANATNAVSGLPANQTWTFDRGYTLGSSPALVGWTFGGWYKEAACTNKVGDASSAITATTVNGVTPASSGTATLYAKWTANSYTINYQLKSGQDEGSTTPALGAKAPTAWKFDTAQELSAPTREGYIFTGWTVTDGLNATYAKWGTTSSPATAISADTTIINTATTSVYLKNLNPSNGATVTLLASWEPISYKVKYDGNKPDNASGKVGKVATTAVNARFDNNVTLNSNTPELTGWTFGGWYKEAACTNFVGNAGASVKNLTTVHNDSVTLFAKWTANTYTLSLNFSSGSGGTTSVTATYDSPLPTIPVLPTRTGYDFAGYFASSGGSGTQYYTSAGACAEGVTYVTAGPSEIFAHWTTAPYTITYELNGGVAPTPDNPSGYTIESASITFAAPAKTGYTFRGWFREAGFVNEATGIETGSYGNKVFFAKWTPNVYVVLYDGNRPSAATGTVGSLPANGSWTYDANATLGGTPTLTGWTFRGWYKEAACSVKSGDAGETLTKPNYATEQDDEVTLFAKWEQNVYTVTYDKNKPTKATSSVVCAENAVWTYDASVTLPAATLIGWTLEGWYSDSALTSRLGAGRQTIEKPNLSSAVDGTATIYAKWIENRYNVTYMPNKPSNASHAVTDLPEPDSGIPYEDVYTLSSEPDLVGWIFLGWYQEASTTHLVGQFGDEKKQLSPDDNATVYLYAKWEAKTFSVTLNNNGETLEGTTEVTATYDSPMPEIVRPGKRGYTFSGYYTEGTPGVQYYGPDGSSAKNADFLVDSVLIAQWSANKYTITFRAEGGSIYPAREDVYFDEYPDDVNQGTRAGYTFVGFFTAQNGLGVQYFDGTGAAIKTWDEDSNTTLFAYWTPNVYLVTLDFTGGDSGTESVEATFDALLPAIATLPERVGYTFAGYYTERAGAGTRYYTSAGASVENMIYTVVGDITLYAAWDLIPYTITYENMTAVYYDEGQENPLGYNIETADITFVEPLRDGYTFDGWYLDDETFLEETLGIPTGSHGDVVVYAKWNINTYNIRYILYGGAAKQGDVYPTNYTIESETIVFDEPEKRGFTFCGWYSDGEYTSPLPEIAQGTFGNVTVHAKWEIIEYAIHYENVDFDTVVNENPAFYTVETETFTLTDPSRRGYDFIEWESEHDVTVEIGSIGEITFSARWEIIHYDITYHLERWQRDEQNLARNGVDNPSDYTVEDEFFFVEAVRAGFTFVAWYAEESYETLVEGIDYGSIGAVEVYGKFVFDAPVIEGNDIDETYSGYAMNIVADVRHGALALCEVEYEWIEVDNHNAISDETTAVYSVKNVADSGRYKVVVTLRYDGEESSSERVFTVAISRATLLVKGVDSELIYGDAAEYGYEFFGLLGVDNRRVVTGMISYAEPYRAGDVPGVYPYDVDLSGATAANYELVAQPGVITVAKRVITAQATELTTPYDGFFHTYSFEMTPDFDFYGKGEGSITATATEDGVVKTSFKERGYREVVLSSTYPENKFDVRLTNGYVNITKAELVIESELTQYAYDGEPHYAIWRVVSGLARGDRVGSVSLRYTDQNGDPIAAPTIRGTYNVEILDYTLSSGDKENYILAPINGELVIDRVYIVVKVNSVTEGLVYNGRKQTAGYDYSVMVGDTLQCNLIYKKDGVVTDPIDAGTYTVTVDRDSIRVLTGAFPADMENYYTDPSTYRITDGTLVIEKKTVSFDVPDDATAVYDATAHQVEYTALGLVGSDRAEATLSYSDNVNVGACSIAVESAEIVEGDPNNYEFDLAETGKLTITKRHVRALVVDKPEGEVYNGMHHYTEARLEEELEETSFVFELAYDENVLAGTCAVRIENYYCSEREERNYEVDYSDVGYITIHKANYDFSRTESFLSGTDYRIGKTYNGETQIPSINVLPVGKDGTVPEMILSGSARDVADGEVLITLTFVSHSVNYVDPTERYEIVFFIRPYETEVVWEYDDAGYLRAVYSAGREMPGAYAYDINGETIPVTVYAEDAYGPVADTPYEVYAELPAWATNYVLTNANERCYVVPKEITARFNSSRSTYDGTEKSVTVTGVGVLRGERVDFDVAFDRTPVDAGTYLMTATLADSVKNYVLVGDNVAEYEIAKRIAKVVAHDLTSVYGQPILATEGEYDQEGFVAGDQPTVVIEKTGDHHVGVYQLVPTVLDSDNYDVRTIPGRYEITPAHVTVFVADQTQKSYTSFTLTAKRGTEEDGDWYVYDGEIAEGDDLGVSLKAIVNRGETEAKIRCYAQNTDYEVTFIGGHEDESGSYAVYKIILTQSYLRLPEDFVNVKVYDGQDYAIPVENTGNGKVTAYVKNKQVKNNFTEVGVYEITFKGTAEQKYFAPEDMIVTFTILPAEIATSSSGVTVKSHDEASGFAMDATIVIKRDDEKAAEASSSVDFFKQVTSFYSISVTEGTMGEVLELSIGDSYKDGDVVTVCLYDGNGYVVKEYTVKEGFIVIDDAANLEGVGIVSDDSIKGLLIIIASVAGGLFVLAIILLPIIFRGRRRY